jgi:hypothetical protein
MTGQRRLGHWLVLTWSIAIECFRTVRAFLPFELLLAVVLAQFAALWLLANWPMSQFHELGPGAQPHSPDGGDHVS